MDSPRSKERPIGVMRKSVELKCGKARTGTTSSVAVKQNSYVKGKDQNLKQGSSGSRFNVLGAREEEGVESTVGANNLSNGLLTPLVLSGIYASVCHD